MHQSQIFHKLTITDLDGRQPFDTVYFEHTTCRSNSQHVASIHQSNVVSSAPSIFVCLSFSLCCNLHVHDCFSERWQFSSRRLPWRSSFAVLLPITALWHRSSLCGSGATPDMIGPMFSPCSEPPRSLAQRLHVASFPQCHSTSKITSTGPTFSLMF